VVELETGETLLNFRVLLMVFQEPQNFVNWFHPTETMTSVNFVVPETGSRTSVRVVGPTVEVPSTARLWIPVVTEVLCPPVSEHFVNVKRDCDRCIRGQHVKSDVSRYVKPPRANELAGYDNLASRIRLILFQFLQELPGSVTRAGVRYDEIIGFDCAFQEALNKMPFVFDDGVDADLQFLSHH
jgi:hypothetical protein